MPDVGVLSAHLLSGFQKELVQAQRIIAEIEARLAELVGGERFAEFKKVFGEIVRSHSRT